MSPVQLPPQKKLKGSFFKRNWWILLVLMAVLLIASGIWYGYRQVQKVKRAYRSVSTVDTDSTAVADTDDLETVDTLKRGAYLLTEPFNNSIDAATLNITGGGATLRLQDTVADLFSVQTTKELFHMEGSVQAKSWTLHFEPTSKKGNELISYLANIKLNNKPVWNVNADLGLADIDFDLSKFNVKSMKLRGGAGKFKIRLGPPLKEINIAVETVATESTFEIPRNASCRIKVNSTSSTTELDGFTKRKENVYETKGFEQAESKIYIDLQGSISDFKVHRY